MRHNRTSRMHQNLLRRRNFIGGASGLLVGLPFLESLPSRSAWAQGENPVFSFVMVSANGVVQERFWPTQEGAISAQSMTGKAVEPLADYASNLLFVGGLSYPAGLRSCGHAEGLCESLTGIGPSSTGNGAQSGGESIDMYISKTVNEQGLDPISLYAGARNYIGERSSFAGRGTARSMQLNPYAAFQELVGVADDSTAPSTPPEGGGGAAPSGPTAMTDEVLIRRKSVLDTVRGELSELENLSGISASDKVRLQTHMEAFREVEVDLVDTGDEMGQMAGDDPEVSPFMASCSIGSLDKAGIEAFSGGVNFSQNGNMIEDIVRLHGEVVALSFACNQNRVAVLQWGDGTDGTKYSGLTGNAVNWPFHQVSHGIQSDSAGGNDPDARDTHAQIDVIRMTTFGQILKHFKERGLFAHSVVYWTSHVATGSHSFNNLPCIVAGSGGGYFKQGQYVSAPDKNGALLAAIGEAAGAGSNFAGASPLGVVKV